jgi:hypothetical protein
MAPDGIQRFRLFRVIRIKFQRETQLIKIRLIAAHSAGQNMDTKILGIGCHPGFMRVMGIDQKQVAGTYMKCRMRKLAGNRTFHQQKKLHGVMPVGGHIGTGIPVIQYAETGVIQISQLFMVVILHNKLPFSL